MRPILLHLVHVDLGTALLAVLGLFLLMLLWRRAARALGEEVPPLSPLGVLLALVLAAATVAVASVLINRFGPVDVKSWGAMLVVGFTVGTLWCMHEGRRYGYPPAIFIDLAVYLLIGAVVGARLVYVLLDLHSYVVHPGTVLALWEGGLSFHGGVGGAVIAGAIFARRHHKPLARLADIVAPGLALGFAFGRVGCFLNGCCYGRPTSLPWGVLFPSATWENGKPITVPVHPTQIYASLASLVIFALLLRARGHMRRQGHLFALYLILYSIWRFFVEFLRRGATAVPFKAIPALTDAQAASIVILVGAALWMAFTWNRGRPVSPDQDEEPPGEEAPSSGGNRGSAGGASKRRRRRKSK